MIIGLWKNEYALPGREMDVLRGIVEMIVRGGGIAADYVVPVVKQDEVRGPYPLAVAVEGDRVVALVVRDCFLTELTDTLGELSGLRELHLDHNQLASLPASIGQLEGLETLRLYGNRCTVVPEGIGSLVGLQDVSLGKNQLASLPDFMWELTGLEVLNVAENRLIELDEGIGNLQRLHTLDVGHNQLVALPVAFEKLSNLTHFLYLSNNRLETLAYSLFVQVDKLRYLNSRIMASRHFLVQLGRWAR